MRGPLSCVWGRAGDHHAFSNRSRPPTAAIHRTTNQIPNGRVVARNNENHNCSQTFPGFRGRLLF